MGNKTIRICSMSGCNEVTMHDSGLCTECKTHIFETATGAKKLKDARPTKLRILWDLLPLGSSTWTRTTSLGELTFKKLENITKVLGL